MNRYTQPRFSSSALITIDMQNDFALENAPVMIEGTMEIIPNMVRLLNAFRANQLPIIHIVRLYLPSGSNVDVCRKQMVEDGAVFLAPGSPGAELVNPIKPDPSVQLRAEELMSGKLQQLGNNEFALYKSRWGAFYQTCLLDMLHERCVDTLVFCGCNFPNCPRTSIYQASERDFRVVLATDAISQLYSKGEQELLDIGVNLLKTPEIEQRLV